MASNPHKPGTPEWQAWLNAEIARHDAEQRKRDAKIDAELKAAAKKAAAEEAARKAKADEEARKRNNS